MGVAGTSGTTFALDDATGCYLLITAHNSTASLNNMFIIRTAGNIAFELSKNSATLTVSVNGANVTVKTQGGTVNVYTIRLS